MTNAPAILYTYPTVDAAIELHDVRVSPCRRVFERGSSGLVECGHTVALRRTHRRNGAEFVTYRCHGAGCSAIRTVI